MKPSKQVRHLMLCVLLAAGAAVPAFAQVSVHINLAPPAPLYEARPVIAPGYTWAPGYWALMGDRHVWVRGRTIVQREGYRWVPDRWDQRGTVYVRQPGNWQRDDNYQSRPHKMERQKKPEHWNHGQGQGGEHGHKGKHGD